MCPPPDTGFTSIIYRLNAFMGVGPTVLGVGVVGLTTVGILVACGDPAASLNKLRCLRKWALGLTALDLVPFVGAVAVVARRVFGTLARGDEWSSWRSQPFSEHAARDLVCSGVILALGVLAASAPALTAALCSSRLSLAAEQRDLEPHQKQCWTALASAPTTLLLALVTWRAASSLIASLHYLFVSHHLGRLAEGIVSLAILIALPLATVAAVLLPVWAAGRGARSKPF